MLAWLQRIWVFALGVFAATSAALTLRSGLPWWTALVIALLALNLHAILLAVEFVLLSRVDPGPGLARPTAGDLIVAWWGEVWTGLQVFCWRQPFRADALPDYLPPSGPNRRGVVLVHGFVCNRGLWNPWMGRLTAAGVPHVAVNLEPVFGSIDEYVQTIDDAVRRLEALGGQQPLIVAHSMGGLAVRAWLRDRDSERRVHSIVTIGTPHGGTWLARFGLMPNARQMRKNNEWLCSLHASETPQRLALFTCFFGNCDNIVFPAMGARLPGADNRHVAGVAHVHLAFQTQVIDEVLQRAVEDRGRLATERQRTGLRV